MKTFRPTQGIELMDKERYFYGILEKLGAIREGHFVLSSGRHSNVYVECAVVMQYPEYATTFAKELARIYAEKKIDAIVTAEMDGIIIAYEVARILQCRAMIAEKVEDKLVLKRDFNLKRREKVLALDDVLTTGKTLSQLLNLIRQYYAIPVGVAVVVDRSNDTVHFDVKKDALVTLDLKSYESTDCPICGGG